MRLLKNTLYVQTQNAWLHKEGETIALSVDYHVKGRFPIHKLDAVVCIGQVSLSPALMAHCTDNGITITHLNQFGKFQARIEGAVSGNILLRREQYRISDNPERTQTICHSLVLGKVHNQRYVIRRYLRDHKNSLADDIQQQLDGTQQKLARGIRHILATKNLPDLLGREGEMARLYFAVFALFIRNTEFAFHGRSRRPPCDAVNALLSFAYTIMTHECRSGLETVGLDPACGFFHQVRAGRPSLALDLVEEMRPIVDRFALSLINKKQLSLKDFDIHPNGAVSLNDRGRQIFFRAWHERKQQKIYHDWFEETVPFGLIPHLQSTIMARHVRGDIDTYVPCLWK